jgi:hypothetical protein
MRQQACGTGAYRGVRVAAGVLARMRRRIFGEGQRGGSAFFGLGCAWVIGRAWRRERRVAGG